MRPKEGGREEEGKREREKVLSTVGSQNRLVAREMRGGTERAYGCFRFRGAGNSGPEAGFDHVNVHNRGPEGE